MAKKMGRGSLTRKGPPMSLQAKSGAQTRSGRRGGRVGGRAPGSLHQLKDIREHHTGKAILLVEVVDVQRPSRESTGPPQSHSASSPCIPPPQPLTETPRRPRGCPATETPLGGAPGWSAGQPRAGRSPLGRGRQETPPCPSKALEVSLHPRPQGTLPATSVNGFKAATKDILVKKLSRFLM